MSVVIDQIIRSKRRSLGLEINAQAKLIIRAPFHLRDSDIHAFILQKKHWIERHQARLSKRIINRSLHQWPDWINRDSWQNRYKYLAYTIIKTRCEKKAHELGLSIGKVKISDAKRRWGSCSPNGNLNFNWRLILAPMFVIDYLIAHELAHVTVKDHSKRFWQRVEKIDPEYLKAEKWLKESGYLLDI